MQPFTVTLDRTGLNNYFCRVEMFCASAERYLARYLGSDHSLRVEYPMVVGDVVRVHIGLPRMDLDWQFTLYPSRVLIGQIDEILDRVRYDSAKELVELSRGCHPSIIVVDDPDEG